MKIAFPAERDEGMESPVYGHFGSAPCFLIVDADEKGYACVENPDHDHAHGQCQPLKAFGGRPVDAVVAGRIGGGALNRLIEAKIRAFRAVEGTVGENLELIRSGKLPEFTLRDTCAGHGPNGGCAH